MALVIPFPIVTDAGTDRLALLELREKVLSVVAGLTRLMVHVLLPGVWMLSGLQTIFAPTVRVMVTVLLLPDEAAISAGV